MKYLSPPYRGFAVLAHAGCYVSRRAQALRTICVELECGGVHKHCELYAWSWSAEARGGAGARRHRVECARKRWGSQAPLDAEKVWNLILILILGGRAGWPGGPTPGAQTCSTRTSIEHAALN